MNEEQLTFFRDEIMGVLGWSDEETEDGTDPLRFCIDKIRELEELVEYYAKRTMHAEQKLGTYIKSEWKEWEE